MALNEKKSKNFSKLAMAAFLLTANGMLLFPASQLHGATVSVNTNWLSRYIGIIAIPAYEKPVFNTTVTAKHENGIYYGIFLSTDVADIGRGQFSSTKGDEINWFAGWKGKVLAGFELDVRGLYLDVKELMNGGNGDMLRAVVEVSHPLMLGNHNVTPYGAFWGTTPNHGIRPERGSQWVAGLRHSVPLFSDLSLNHDADLRKEDGFAKSEPDVILRYNGTLNWKLTPDFTFNPVVLRYWAPLTDSKKRDPEWVYGFGATYLFR